MLWLKIKSINIKHKCNHKTKANKSKIQWAKHHNSHYAQKKLGKFINTPVTSVSSAVLPAPKLSC